MKTSGSIELILGPMFSGKSTELLRRVERNEHAKKKCLLVKYAGDIRFGKEAMIKSHGGITKGAVIAKSLHEIDEIQQVEKYQVIGIDEGQFFADTLYFAEKWANSGIKIIISGLDGTYQRKPFSNTLETCNLLELIPKSESMIKLLAVCVDCGSDAAFTYKEEDGKEVDIGGSEKYYALCRDCHITRSNTCSLSQHLPAGCHEEDSVVFTKQFINNGVFESWKKMHNIT